MSTTDRLAAIVTTFEELLFKKLDRLHAEGIHDTEVIRFLRSEGHTLLATRYIEWSNALDPDVEDDSTTTDPTVPDPSDGASYTQHPLNIKTVNTTFPLGKIEDKR